MTAVCTARINFQFLSALVFHIKILNSSHRFKAVTHSSFFVKYLSFFKIWNTGLGYNKICVHSAILQIPVLVAIHL